MSDASNLAKNIRDRFSGTTEERLGRALSDLLENPLLTGAIGRAFDARDKASQAQEVAFGRAEHPLGGGHRTADAAVALGLPSPRGHRGRRSSGSTVRSRRRAAASRRSISGCRRSRNSWVALGEAGVRAGDEPRPGSRPGGRDRRKAPSTARKARWRQDQTRGSAARAQEDLSSAGRERAHGHLAHRLGRGEQRVVIDSLAPGLEIEGVRDGEQAGDREAVVGSERKQRRGLHLDGDGFGRRLAVCGRRGRRRTGRR